MTTRVDTAFTLLSSQGRNETFSDASLGASSEPANMLYGEAQSDDFEGYVDVLIDHSDQVMSVSTDAPVRRGNRVTILYQTNEFKVISVDGIDTTRFEIRAQVSTVSAYLDGTYAPSVLVFDAYLQKDSASPKTNYAGTISIKASSNGATWHDIKTSSDQSSLSVSVAEVLSVVAEPRNIRADLLDEEGIVIAETAVAIVDKVKNRIEENDAGIWIHTGEDACDSGSYNRLAAEGVYLGQDGTDVAEFGKTVVKLGMNSKDSRIEMCDGIGKVEAQTVGDSERLILSSGRFVSVAAGMNPMGYEDRAYFYATNYPDDGSSYPQVAAICSVRERPDEEYAVATSSTEVERNSARCFDLVRVGEKTLERRGWVTPAVSMIEEYADKVIWGSKYGTHKVAIDTTNARHEPNPIENAMAEYRGIIGDLSFIGLYNHRLPGLYLVLPNSDNSPCPGVNGHLIVGYVAGNRVYAHLIFDNGLSFDWVGAASGYWNIVGTGVIEAVSATAVTITSDTAGTTIAVSNIILNQNAALFSVESGAVKCLATGTVEVYGEAYATGIGESNFGVTISTASNTLPAMQYIGGHNGQGRMGRTKTFSVIAGQLLYLRSRSATQNGVVAAGQGRMIVKYV